MSDSLPASPLTQRLSPILIAATPVMVLMHNRVAVLPALAIALLGLWEAIRARIVPRPLPRSVAAAMAAILAWGAIASLWAFKPSFSAPRVIELIGLILTGVFAIHVLGLMDRRRLLAATMIGVAIGCVVVMADIATGYHLIGAVHGRNPVPDLTAEFRGHFKAGATLVAMWSGVAMWAGLKRRWWWRSAAMLVLIGALTIVTSSGGGLLAIVLGTGAGLATLVLPRLTPILAGAVALALTLAAPLAIHMPSTLDLALRFPRMPNSTLHRTMIWHFTATKILERPLLGWGLDGSRVIPGAKEGEVVYMHAGPDDPPVPGLQPRLPLHPHDFALQIWLELGAVGAVLVAGLLAAIVAAAARLPRGPVRAGAIATFVAAIVVSAVGYGIWQAWWLASLWLTTALLTALGREDTGA